MKVEILPDDAAVARRASEWIAAAARAAASARGRFALALSGGRTPGQMLEALSQEDVPWHALQIFQVDERIAPAGDRDRNWTQLHESLLTRAPLRPEQVHAMPVEEADLERAARHYARTLRQLTGDSPLLDLVHLGLGADGHTASLVPGDPVLEVTDRDVAITGSYQGRQRMTLTYPAIDRARERLWLVTGSEKADVLLRLRDGDRALPAGRVRRESATVLADAPAARALGGS